MRACIQNWCPVFSVWAVRSLFTQDWEHDKQMYLGLSRAEDRRRDFCGNEDPGGSPIGDSALFALMNESFSWSEGCPPCVSVAARCSARGSAWYGRKDRRDLNESHTATKSGLGKERHWIDASHCGYRISSNARYIRRRRKGNLISYGAVKKQRQEKAKNGKTQSSKTQYICSLEPR